MTAFRNKLTRRGIAVLALSLAAVLGSSALAGYAYWGLRSSSTISVSAGSVETPAVSCTQVGRNEVRISWSGNPGNGVTGYTLVTSSSSGGSSTRNFGPGTTSINDSFSGRGGIIISGSATWTYTVTAAYGSWTSPENSTSARGTGATFLRSATLTCN